MKNGCLFLSYTFIFNSLTYKTEHNFLIPPQTTRTTITTKKDKQGKTPKFSFNLYFRELKGNGDKNVMANIKYRPNKIKGKTYY